MITYQFSTREKILLVVLALIVVFVAWFMLVYQNTTAQITSLEAEIETAKSSIQIDEARVSQLQAMKASIEQHEAAGDQPAFVPEYDNLQPLMSELNSIMNMTENYAISFDGIAEDGGEFVQRGVRIDYSCGSYDQAEAVVYALADGAFPCSIDTVSISSAASSRGAAGAGASASVHVTFFESRSS